MLFIVIERDYVGYFKSTERKDTFVISLYPWDIRPLKYGFYLLIPPLKETHIRGNWN